MKNYKQLIKELPSKTIVFAFGRFNPPTIGHELLIKAVKKLAQQKNADHVIYASGSQDAKKNPLSVDKKVKYLQLMFKGTNFASAGGDARTFIEAAKKLNKKYKNIVMVAGSDRVPEFKRLLNTYNGKDFHFDTIEVISAGERDPDSDDATGMSASKMRAVAAKGDYSQFKKGLPSSMREIDGRRLMNDVRQGMGLEAVTEHLNLAKDELREQYFRGEIFNIGDIVESSGVSYEIVKRGTNHLLLKEESGTLVSKWIRDVKLLEDVKPGYAPTEISFGGYTTKNLHHAPDASKAFQDTIDRVGKSKASSVLHALMATDTYMGLGDLHINQGKAPTGTEQEQWSAAHKHAKEHLEEIGEFMHHADYWTSHMHEMEAMLTNYKESGKDELRDSFDLGDTMISEELTQKTLKSNDKIKVARVIATMLGVDNVEASANPEMIVNQGLRKIRSKALNPEALSVVGRMLKLASSLGIEYDNALVPSKLKEAVMQPSGTDKIETAGPVDLMRFKSYSGKIGHTLHHDETPNADQVRKMKIKQQLGERSNVEKEMLDVKHAREKESLAKKHEREKASVSEEVEQIDEVSVSKYSHLGANKNTTHFVKNVTTGEIVSPHRSKSDAEDGQIAAERDATSGHKFKVVRATHVKEEVELEENHLMDYRRYTQAAKNAKSKGDHDIAKDAEQKASKAAASYTKVTGKKPTFNEEAELSEAVIRLQHKDSNGNVHVLTSSSTGHVALNKGTSNLANVMHSAPGHERSGTADKSEALRKAIKAAHGGGKDSVLSAAKKTTGLNWTHHSVSESYEEADLNEDVYAKSEENKRSADAAKKQGDMFAHHLHMSDYHDNLSQWHSERGRHGEADKHAAKSEEHHEKAMSLKEEVAEPTGDLKDACWKGYTAVGMKKKNGKMVPNCVPVKEEAVEESLKPGWMLKKDPVLAKRLKDAIKVAKARKASYGNPTAGVSAKPVNEDVCPECREEPCSCSGAGIQSPAFDPFFKESAVDVTDYEEKWEDHLFATEEPTDEEIEHFMSHLSDNEIYELYDDDELALVDDETGEEVPEEEEEKAIDEQVLSEVLSRVERMKAKFRIRKTKAKRERATKIALRRHSNTKTINKRSRRLAVKLMKKRLLRGRDPSKISVGEKERVERTIETRKKLIDRLAMRLTPRVRKIETSRLNHTKFTGASNVAI